MDRSAASDQGKAVLREPHFKSTTQGLDGLMIELDEISRDHSAPRSSQTNALKTSQSVFATNHASVSYLHHGSERANFWQPQAALLEKIGSERTNEINAAAPFLTWTIAPIVGA
jgi:hypothetical protein